MTNNTNTSSDSVLSNIVAPLGLLLILLSTAVPFLAADIQWAQESYRYIYGVGALVLLASRLFTPFRGSDMRLKRLHRIEAWSAIFFCAATFFLFYPEGTGRDWLAFTLAGATIQIITSIAIPHRQRKLKEQ